MKVPRDISHDEIVIGMLKAETGTLELQYRFFKEAGEH